MGKKSKRKKSKLQLNKIRALNIMRYTNKTKSNQQAVTDQHQPENEWISCQADANKLVQPGARIIDEDYFPEDNTSFPKENASLEPNQSNFPDATQPGSPEATQPGFNSAVKIQLGFPEEIQTGFLVDIQPGTPQEIKQLHSEVQASLGNPDTEDNFNHDDKDEIVLVTDDEWMIKKQLCRCCLAEGTFISLTSRAADGCITYNDILNSFSIELFPVASDEGDALRSVCDLCAVRLRDAHAFCQQVHACDARFRTLYTRNCIKVANIMLDVEVNSEPDADDNFAAEIDENSSEPQLLVIPKESKPRARETLRPQRTQKKKQWEVVPAGPPKKPLKYRKHKKSPQRLASDKYLKVGDMYKCTQCDITRSNQSAVVRHFNLIHLGLQCTHCNDRFSTRIRLQVHKLQAHNIDERYKCGACDNSYNTKRQLTLHTENYHKLGELKKCSECDFESYNRFYLLRHKIKHKSGKDFQCQFCKKSFLRKTTLNYHERIHTGDKRKACAECGQAFVQKASLNYHMTKYHPDVKF